MKDKTITWRYRFCAFLIFIGVGLRFFVMTLGHNYDWESYNIVGEIACNFRNVYAETSRYNYGFIFFCIQGLLYRVANLLNTDYEPVYRVLMVTVLTCADLSISYFIGKRYSIAKAMIFFLNPISIMITGYHNQFDNIAILFALISIIFYKYEIQNHNIETNAVGEDALSNDAVADKISKYDVCFVLFLTLSFVTKHIIFMMPVFLLFRKELPIRKKLVFVCVPPALFLLSFVPFVIGNHDAMQGIINNVFLYRSAANTPLLATIYRLTGFPDALKFPVFICCMVAVAFITRKETYEYQLMIYLISLVTFSSAVANQYLVIPMVALCVLDVKKLRYVYMLVVGGCLICNMLGITVYIQNTYTGLLIDILVWFVRRFNMWAAWILFATLMYELIVKRYRKIKEGKEEHLVQE